MGLNIGITNDYLKSSASLPENLQKYALWAKAREGGSPGLKPSLDLDFAGNKSLIDNVTGQNLVTFTRASSATYFDSQGVLQTATTDVPRFDHDPVTGESLGLLVEESRANLLLRSEEFDNASWAQVNVGVSPNTTVAPDNQTTADTLSIIASPANLFRQNVTVTASTTYTFSFYVRRGTATDLTYSVFDFSSSTDIVAPTSYYAQTSSSEWRRISVTFTTPAGCTSIGVYPIRSNPSTGTVHLWGAMLEVGSFPTSYIPTTTATVTRSADVASITGSAFSSFYRQDEGTVFAKYLGGSGPLSRRVVSINDSTANNVIQVIASNSSGTSSNYLDITLSSSNQSLLGTGTAYTSTSQTSSVAYRVNDIGFSKNGQSTAVDTSATLPVVSQMDIGAITSTNYLNGTINRLTYWRQRLPNSTIQSITQ